MALRRIALTALVSVVVACSSPGTEPTPSAGRAFYGKPDDCPAIHNDRVACDDCAAIDRASSDDVTWLRHIRRRCLSGLVHRRRRRRR